MSKNKKIYKILKKHAKKNQLYPDFPTLIEELQKDGLNHKFQKTLQQNLVLNNLTYESFYNNLIFTALINQDPKLAETTRKIKETLKNELEILYTNEYPESFSNQQLNKVHEPKQFFITCFDPFQPIIITYNALMMLFENDI